MSCSEAFGTPKRTHETLFTVKTICGKQMRDIYGHWAFKIMGGEKKLTQPPMDGVKGDDCIIAGFPVVHGRQPQGHGK